VLARLLPDGYRDDAEAAGEFRRYTEPALRNAKYQAAQEMLDTLPESGGRIQLTRDQALSWLKALNDVRLALGVRLGVTEEFEEAVGPAEAGRPAVERVRGVRLARRRPGVARPGDALSALPSLSMLTIPRALYDKIVAHARADHPDEACGVIAGPAGSDRPERFIAMMNAERSPTFYRFDSAEQFRVWREMDDNDEEPVVIYHSHTATEAYPSRTTSPTPASRRRTTCWSPPGTMTRPSSAPTGSPTAPSPRSPSPWWNDSVPRRVGRQGPTR